MTETQANHIITLENLSIGYDKHKAILGDLNLSVRPGEMVALIGRNGTGKSTLLKSMIGLIPLMGGACRLDAMSVHLYDPRKRAQKVSYVSSQVSQLPSLTVFELVSLGRMPHTGWLGKMSGNDRKLVINALKEVQLETFMERKMDQLSDGERQRAMIARALVQNTPLMVLDEPTAFLDIPNKFELIHILSGFRNGGKSIIYSTHDLETAMICADKLWVIHDGQIFSGAPEDLGMSGIFNTIFEPTGITFDEGTRRFRYAQSSKGNIRLSGEQSNAIIWTRNALDRMGYNVNPVAESLLQVNNTESGFEWLLSRNEETISFESIYNLAQFLNKDN